MVTAQQNMKAQLRLEVTAKFSHRLVKSSVYRYKTKARAKNALQYYVNMAAADGRLVHYTKGVALVFKYGENHGCNAFEGVLYVTTM